MPKFNTPLEALRYHVTGAIERGEGEAIVGIPACQIRWIDSNGNPTPDNNPAVARVRTIDRYQMINGRNCHFPQSGWYYICADHAKQLSRPGMEIWECESLD